MTDEPKEQVAAPPWLTKTALAGLVAIGIAYGWLRLGYGPATLAEHGQLGDALAPVAELLMLAALLAALYSAHLQRIELGLQRNELALQRREMRESRDEMVEQRKQLERSAEAQEALAEATDKLASAQIAANRRAASLEMAQRESTLATLTASRATVEAAMIGFQGGGTLRYQDFTAHLERVTKEQGDRLDELAERIENGEA